MIIPVINEVFHRDYDGDEQIVFHQNEHFITQQGGSESKVITDSYFEIMSGKGISYHMECESSPDSSIFLRMFEYDSQIALNTSVLSDNVLHVNFPNSAVLYLRHNSRTPDKLTICIHTSSGEFSYFVQIMKTQTYTLGEIFEKNLLFLIPFYIFTHESRFNEYINHEEKLDILVGEFKIIRDKLTELCHNEVINEFTKQSILDMTKKVMANLTVKYPDIQRGVADVMGGKVLEYEAKTILNQGIEMGKNEGMELGRSEGMLNSINLLLRMGVDNEEAIIKVAEEFHTPENDVRKIWESGRGLTDLN